MNYYLDVLKKYADFSGRARRKEYWMFALINIVIVIVLSFIGSAVFGATFFGFDILSTLYSLVVLVPSLAVSIRRLHDTGRSAWWLLVVFIPIIGGIVLLILMCFDSNQNANQYGANPKGVTAKIIS